MFDFIKENESASIRQNVAAMEHNASLYEGTLAGHAEGTGGQRGNGPAGTKRLKT